MSDCARHRLALVASSNPPNAISPSFLDYLYVRYTNATAFSPTETVPMTVVAKTLMGVQSVASVLTVALVAARAVNILT